MDKVILESEITGAYFDGSGIQGSSVKHERKGLSTEYKTIIQYKIKNISVKSKSWEFFTRLQSENCKTEAYNF